jgi:hypothetical protein
MITITNAFSLNMLSSLPLNVRVSEVKKHDFKNLINLLNEEGYTSAVGHADTAAILSNQLGIHIPMNRVTVSLEAGDGLLVGQYVGPRLEEGTTTLPEGATIKWLLVSIS